MEAFNFEEEVDGTDHTKYLWGNAAYAFATRLTESFAKSQWCAAIIGVEGGGLVSGLPAHTFKTDEGGVALKCPTEVSIDDRREKELSDLGFIPLIHCKNTDYAAFFDAQSAQKPQLYNTHAANANARLSTQLPYIFSTARFAHYLKAMMRDKVGSFMSRADCQRFLNTWISGYVTEDDSASPAVKAQFPLREARIDVVDVPGKPGCVQGGGVPQAPLPAQGADRLAPARGRAAAPGARIEILRCVDVLDDRPGGRLSGRKSRIVGESMSPRRSGRVIRVSST